MGYGLGLEVGNTIYFDMPPDQFAYWNTDDAGKAMLRNLIRSGHIDCLHSFGDLATTRGDAGRALDELDRHDCSIKVWIDHRTAPTNFDGKIMMGSGDVLGSPAYHADLTCDFGIKYAWKGRVTSVIGQNIPRTMAGIWQNTHPLSSAKTILKEIGKGFVASIGNTKYTMHASNEVLRKTTLRDGRKIWEFMRSNPSWGGVSCFETGEEISKVLTEKMLNTLVRKKGFCVLYTHLGKLANPKKLFPLATKIAFLLLKKFADDNEILVTTTQRLLTYRTLLEEIKINTVTNAGAITIEILTGQQSLSLDGLTFYSPSKNLKLFYKGKELKNLTFNPPDETGEHSVSVSWKPLCFPN